jgi:hypothetical protein
MAASPPADPPPLPRVNLARVFADRRDLYTKIWDQLHDGDRPAGRDFAWLVADVMEVLGGRGIGRRVVEDSLAVLIDRPLTEPLVRETAWRLAGNVPRLRRGLPVYPWAGQDAPEWVPLQLTAAILAVNARGRRGCDFGAIALAGSYCPGKLDRWWSREQCGFLARELGFSTSPSGKMRYQHPYQLVGLRLLGLFEPERCRDGRPGFHRIAATSALVAHNKRVLRRRFRIDPCPYNFIHDCHRCAIGYKGAAGCPAATHARTYVAAACPGCGQADMPFDLDLPGTLCVACATRARLTVKE